MIRTDAPVIVCCILCAAATLPGGENRLRRGHAQKPAEAARELAAFKRSSADLAGWDREKLLVFGPGNPYPADAVKPNTPLP